MQRNGYPRLPPAAFPGGTMSGTVSTVPYPNGSLAAPSQPAGGFSAGPSLYRPALSPQHAAACGYLSRPVAPAAPVSGISPFFGAGSVRSVSQAAQPDFAVGQRRIPPQLQLQEHSAQQSQQKQQRLLADLGLAYSGLEGYDEAAVVGQAQLGSQMQSQLRNLLDLTGDTPRAGGGPAGSPHVYSSPKAWAAASSSPKARAAATRPSQLPRPGPEYSGPRIEPTDAPISLEWVMELVCHFQHHPQVPLPARYLCRLLDDAERILEARDKDGPVQTLSLQPSAVSGRSTLRPPASSFAEQQMILVGDLHGQLADLLWIFYKLGVPSLTNRYLINGDVCDRGTNATEIWALLSSSRI
ncbi:unnamed protein product [Polarella glacialis]|uniref:Protein-serine/threonine phosphatase n=1 Tax=Polarella glacialis TaxID=89957 RepID=A0A813KQI3_POLGL|nr:unnamed protein product [Polarella glacialis]